MSISGRRVYFFHYLTATGNEASSEVRAGEKNANSSGVKQCLQEKRPGILDVGNLATSPLRLNF